MPGCVIQSPGDSQNNIKICKQAAAPDFIGKTINTITCTRDSYNGTAYNFRTTLYDKNGKRIPELTDIVIRYNLERQPIKIYLSDGLNIDCEKLPDDFSKMHLDWTIQGLELWNDELICLGLNWKLVKYHKDAHLGIFYRENFDDANKYGDATFSAESIEQNGKKILKRIYPEIIELGLFESTKTNLIEQNRFISIAGHEFGHSLGLTLHSTNSSDLMYWMVPNESKIVTENDATTLFDVYDAEDKIAD
jgi:hypothetical protein